VSEVRHLAGGANSNAAAATFDRFSPVATEIIAGIAERAVEVTGDASIRSSIEQEIKKRYDRWQTEQTATGGLLTFRRVSGGGQTYLLRRPEEDARWVQWTCPNSLRETEPNVNLIIERHKRNRAWVSEPPFGAPVPPGADAGAADSGDGTLDAEGADLDDLPTDPDDEAISVADSEALS
jgi:hypothetical protein